jgi:hypothetical protein
MPAAEAAGLGGSGDAGTPWRRLLLLLLAMLGRVALACVLPALARATDWVEPMPLLPTPDTPGFGPVE